MINEKQISEAFSELGQLFLFLAGQKVLNQDKQAKFEYYKEEAERLIQKAGFENSWFTRENIYYALRQWGKVLNEGDITRWIENYPRSGSAKNIGLVMAGNIPLVGFHDLLAVLISGHNAVVKPSSKDKALFDLVYNYLLTINGEFDQKIKKVERLENFDAVIATGSNNTARYFEYYFEGVPNIIRKNRTSVAVLTGEETKEDLMKLSEDIFRYFGLGCRNVTHLYLPEAYDLNKLFEVFFDWKEIFHHNKYAHNYEYNRAIYLMTKESFLDNNFAILKENSDLFSPVGVIHYTSYNDLEMVRKELKEKEESIQCIASGIDLSLPNQVAFGETQKPKLTDYADGVDTLKFLSAL